MMLFVPLAVPCAYLLLKSAGGGWSQAAAIRLQTYNEICEKLVTENVFSQYVYKTLPSCNHLWVFKKTFCAQSALSGELVVWSCVLFWSVALKHCIRCSPPRFSRSQAGQSLR
jgi:hypothetical protein